MHVFSINTSELKFNDRLIPAFYYYTKEMKKENEKLGVNYICLGDYASISDGEHSAIPRNSKDGVRYLYGRNIKEGVVDYDPISDAPFIDVEDYNEFSRCHINQYDVLIAIYGTVGKSAVYREEYIGTAGIPRHIANISIKKNSPITPEYLSAFFRSKYGKYQMYSLMTGNLQQLLSLKNLREFDVPLVNESLMELITKKEKEAVECEIKAQQLINEAQHVLYGNLNFDVHSIKRDFSFSVNSSKVFETDIWSPAYYDPLYVKMEKALIDNNRCCTVNEICENIHGDEAGSSVYKEFVERDIKYDKPFIRTSDIVNHEADLYPDYFIPEEQKINQDIRPNDVLFTKDGKIGCAALVTTEDNMVISSGIERLRLNNKGKTEGLTEEYLFLAMATPEIGRYGAIRRTVVASTIPHLREKRLEDIILPVIDHKSIDKITELIHNAFVLKGARKKLIKEIDILINEKFPI